MRQEILITAVLITVGKSASHITCIVRAQEDECKTFNEEEQKQEIQKIMSSPETQDLIEAADSACQNCDDKLAQTECARLMTRNSCQHPATKADCMYTCGYCCDDCPSCTRAKRSLIQMGILKRPKRQSPDRLQLISQVVTDLNFENVKVMAGMNSGNAGTSYCVEPNKFAALTEDEFRLVVGNFDPESIDGTEDDSDGSDGSDSSDSVPPPVGRRRREASRTKRQSSIESWDTGPVDNQGSCGSCWIFAGLHAISGRMRIAKRQSFAHDLSEMQAAECLYRITRKNVCGGGTPVNVFKWATHVAISDESSYQRQYPSRGSDVSSLVKRTKSCRTSGTPTLTSWGKKFFSAPEAELKAELQNGPIVANLKIGKWKYYGRGIVHGVNTCGAGNQGYHAVVIVGYGVKNGIKYWLAKNSWGTSWGERGYIKIQRFDKSSRKRGLGPCELMKWAFAPGPVRGFVKPKPTPRPEPKSVKCRNADCSLCRHCDWWADHGYCRFHYYWMKSNCAKSCNIGCGETDKSEFSSMMIDEAVGPPGTQTVDDMNSPPGSGDLGAPPAPP